MVFIVGNDKKLSLEPEAKSPEIYRVTPYEFAETAEPIQDVVTCIRPIPVQSSTISTNVRTSVRLLPASMIEVKKLA